MTLGEKQRLFTRLIADLIIKAYDLGYEITLGDAFRDPRVFGSMGDRKGYGNSESCHKYRLAIDLNLFKDGVYLTGTEDHRPLGEWWEKQHELCRWGGEFKNSKGEPTPDGNHYSFEHNGNM